MRTLIVLLLFAGLASGQTLTLPDKLNVPPNKEFVLSGKTDCVSVVWYFPDGELPPGFTLEDLFDVPPTWKKKVAAIQLNSGSVEKTYRVVAVGANAKGAQTSPQICVVTVGNPAPPPAIVPVITSPTSAACELGATYSYQITATANPVAFLASPLPPGLTLSPTGLISGVPTVAGTTAITIQASNNRGTGTAVLSLTVTGKVDPAPIPDAGFRVMVVFESDGKPGGLTPAQLAGLRSQTTRDYLASRCVKESTGRPAYRLYDQNIDQTADLDVWKKAMARPRKSIPWIVVSNGTIGFEGPLPADEAGILELLKKYGGN